MSLGKPGGGGLGAKIAGWRQSLLRSAADVVVILRREGITGGLREVLSGRREAFASISRRGALDELANTKRPGPNMYVSTDLQLSRAMKADFKVTYLRPGATEAETYTRSMLMDKDRTKGAILREFERRLNEDIQASAPDYNLYGVQVLQIDFVGLQQRSDVDYEWEPDDAPW
jgi:hypothetical protein